MVIRYRTSPMIERIVFVLKAIAPFVTGNRVA